MRMVIGSLLIGLVFAAPNLQAGDRSESFMLSNGCINCHGFEGQRAPGAIPSLAGQSEAYLYKTLAAYRDGTLKGTIMNRAMEGYDDQTLRRFAKYYSSLPRKSLGSAVPKAHEQGERLYAQHCSSCHEKQADTPYVTGQNSQYMQGVLKDMATGHRTMPEEMASAISALKGEELQQLLGYLQGCAQKALCR
ncbi:putative cytochrome c4 [Pseudomonas synxantha]|uniref:c-type cytochrome n=1 Tax=Pseudomonas synxantha TaxID=47883 RepID=UPI000F57A3BF|nr:c-type cytochrome [Pseudomonas synxantha]AZE74106.1 putative cytochrome c4 [Pseudomonas synxantha]